MPLYSTHSQQDALLQVTTSLGDNNATTRGNAIDLGAVNPFPTTGKVTVQIATTAGNGANNKNVNIRLEHSDVNTNANFTNIAELAILTIPEVSAAYAATTRNVALPPSAKRYIRTIAVTENTGGNASNGTVVLKILT